jgi:hypothetical protein
MGASTNMLARVTREADLADIKDELEAPAS